MDFSFFIWNFLSNWISWPDITSRENWKCFIKIINDSKQDKLYFKRALSSTPKFLLKSDSNDYFSKLRIVSDACFC